MWLQPRITIADPEVLKQVMIKEASTFRDREVGCNVANDFYFNVAWKSQNHVANGMLKLLIRIS